MKIHGISLPDNCTLSFHANGVKVGVSLNISKKLLGLMPRNNVWKGNKMFVYVLSKEIPLKYSTPKNMKAAYEHLLNKAMQNIRLKKLELIDDEITQLEQCQQKLNF